MKRLGYAGAMLLFSLSACTGGSGNVDSDTTTRGESRYADSETDQSGESKQPAAPPEQPASDPMLVEVSVEGTGDMSGLDPECSLDGSTGSFDGLYFGEANLDDGGAYVAGMASSQASFQTPSGCEIPELEISAVTEVVVRGTLSATTQNCETYCEAKARSYGESECDAGASECRAQAESEYQGSCETSCTSSTTHVIAAETRLSMEQTAEVSARQLSGSALGELEVDLTFDHMETEEGETVEEAP